MSIDNINNPIKTTNLFGHSSNLNEIIYLYQNNNLPKATLFSGKKGIGKFTFVNHFLIYIFDKKNYDLKHQSIDINSLIYKNILNETFQNIIYLGNGKKASIDDIRKLKETISKSTIDNNKRFIIIDEVEMFNVNSLNALLKIIEETTENNYFILIDNQQKKLLETISSRCIKKRIFLSNKERIDIINKISNKFSINQLININKSNLSPGAYLLYNNISQENNISENMNYLDKIDLLLNLYKKKKDLNYIYLSIFYTEEYISLISNNCADIFALNETKNKIIKNINNFAHLNLNLSSVLTAIDSQFDHE
jgi:DNA polymerase-3 subunit delta'